MKLTRLLQRYNRRRIARTLGCAPHEIEHQAVYLPSLKAIYFRVPKVANTTIVTTLVLESGLGGPSNKGRDLKLAAAREITGNLRAFHAAVHDPNVVRFTFVRHPYNRIASVFFDKFQRAGKDRYRDEVGLPRGDEVTLLQFLRAIEFMPPPEMNRHWRPQSIQVPDVTLDFVGHLETFDSDFAALRQRIGCNAEAAVTSRRRTGGGNMAQRLIGPEEKAIIDRIYERDFERFGYERSL